MAKTRVYELARELKLESKALLEKLQHLGISVASHQSTLTVAQVDKIREALSTVSKPKVVVRKRRRKVEEPVAASEPTPGGEAASASTDRAPEGDSRETESDTAAEDHGNQSSGPETVPDTVSQLESSSVEENTETVVAPAQSEASAEESVRESKPKTEPSSGSLSSRGSDPDRVESARVLSRPSNPVRAGAPRPARPTPGDSDAFNFENFKQPSKVASIDKILEEDLPLEDKKGRLEAEIIRLAAEDAKVLAEAKSVVRTNRARDRRDRDRGAQGIRRYSSGRDEAGSSDQQDAKRRPSRENWERGSRGESEKVGGQSDAANAAPAMPDDSSGRDRVRGKGKAGPTGKRWEEEQPRVKQPTARRRSSMSVRVLLSDSDEDTAAPAGPRRRTIYTPSGPAQKKRDLRRRRDLKATQITTPRAAYRIVKISGEAIAVSELAKQLSVKAAVLIQKLMAQGVMATINQAVDFETASLIASEFGYECKDTTKTVEGVLAENSVNLEEFGTASRPPIITVMGHVDHGKTSILDAIRRSDVASQEAGGITQHIGAYSITRNNEHFTFLDTPGHAAFSAMRARGAQLTDIVVLVVAADDGVMPQTLEAISHAKDAGVPIIVAVNKVDKANVNFDRIYSELSEQGVQSEEWGGDTQFVKVSAINDQGIDDLLEAIKLLAEMSELKSRATGPAEGVVVEAKLDKGRGPVATIMVTQGQLDLGQYIVAGNEAGRVRGMFDHNRQKLDKATPATPVEVIGLTGVPMAGDQVHVVKDEKVARAVIDLRGAATSSATPVATVEGASAAEASLEEMLMKVASEDVPRVPIILKADTQGSVEAIAENLSKLNTSSVRNAIIHKGVGGVNESDVILAETSGAIILGFNVRGVRGLGEEAEKRGVVIKFFGVIYELTDAVRHVMAGQLPPVCTEVVQGHAEVREPISVPKVGVVAGSAVLDGKITRTSHLRLLRNEIVVYTGKISSLRRFKDDVKEVQHGYECGIAIEGYNDIKAGDIIEAYQIEETAATLDVE